MNEKKHPAKKIISKTFTTNEIHKMFEYFTEKKISFTPKKTLKVKTQQKSLHKKLKYINCNKKKYLFYRKKVVEGSFSHPH